MAQGGAQRSNQHSDKREQRGDLPTLHCNC
jgi:hypothetical protein